LTGINIASLRAKLTAPTILIKALIKTSSLLLITGKIARGRTNMARSAELIDARKAKNFHSI